MNNNNNNNNNNSNDFIPVYPERWLFIRQSYLIKEKIIVTKLVRALAAQSNC